MKQLLIGLVFLIPSLVQGQNQWGEIFSRAGSEGFQAGARAAQLRAQREHEWWMQQSRQAHELRMQEMRTQGTKQRRSSIPEVSDAQDVVILLALHIDRRRKDVRNAYSTGTLSADDYRELERNLMVTVREIREGLPPDLRRLFNLALK